jgi:hypothetical protein
MQTHGLHDQGRKGLDPGNGCGVETAMLLARYRFTESQRAFS